MMMMNAAELVAKVNGTSGTACFAVLALFSVSLCLGRLLSIVLSLKWRHPLLRFSAELVAGMDLTALGVLLWIRISGTGEIPAFLNFVVCLSLPFGIWLMLGTLRACLHGFFPLRRESRGGKKTGRSGSEQRRQKGEKNAFLTHSPGRRKGRLKKQVLPLLLIMLPLCLYGASAFCPASAWDELVYQIALPLRWKGSFGGGGGGGWETLFYPDLPYSAFPSLAQLICLPLLEYSGAVGMKLFAYCVVLFLTVGIYSLLRLRCSRMTASVFCFCLLSSPIFGELLMKDFYVEPLIALHFVAALALLKGCRRGGGGGGQEPGGATGRKAVAAGWICGGMAALKLTALPLVFCIGLSGALMRMFATGKKRDEERIPEGGKRRKTSLEFLIPFTLVALAYSSCFYLRGWLETGNPFYPYFCAWFPGTEAVRACSEFHHAISTGKYGLASPLLSLAAAAFFVSLRAFRGIYDGCYGLQFLLLLLCWCVFLLSSLRKLRKERGRGPSGSGGVRGVIPGGHLADLCLIVLYVSWCFSSQQARFLLPSAVLLLLALSKHFAPSCGGKFWRRGGKAVLLGLLLCLSLASFTPGTARHYLLCWKYVLDERLRPVDYVLSALNPGYVDLMDALWEDPGKKTLLLFEERTLYLPPACRVGTPFFQPEVFTPPESAGSVAETLEKKGYERMVFRAPENCPDMMPKYLERALPLVERLGREIASGRLKIVRTLPGGYFLLEPSASEGR